ncbi:DUF6232 family protein [Dactylosporangium sp. NPDC050688]|uniref:DUF6232 family protein n=1 Tax=Dactylosporangium sp. NPDC050688 TaxID=3157217 RepID=UPI0033DE75E1
MITEEIFALWSPEPRVFVLDEVQGVHVVRGSIHPARIVLMVIGILAVVGVVVAWPVIDSAGEYLFAVAAIVAPPMVGSTSRALTPRTLHLVGRHLGVEVTLFTSSDMLMFGQVKRALMRAFEARSRSLDRRDLAGYDEAYHMLNRVL